MQSRSGHGRAQSPHRPPNGRNTAISPRSPPPKDISTSTAQGTIYDNPKCSPSQPSLASNLSKKLPSVGKAIGWFTTKKGASSSKTSLAAAHRQGGRTHLGESSTLNDTRTTEGDAQSISSLAEANEIPATMVQDYETIARCLGERLASAQSELSHVEDHRAALQTRIESLETEVRDQEIQKRLAEEIANQEKTGLISAHATEMASLRQEVQELQRIVEVLKNESGEASRENDTLHQEIAGLKDQGEQTEAKIEVMRKQVDEANGALLDLKDWGNAIVADSEEAKKKLIERVNQLRHQLEHSEEHAKECEERIRQLKTTEVMMMGTLQKVEAAVEEKSRIIDDLQLRNTTLTGEVGLTKKRVVEKEGKLLELESQMQLAEEAASRKYTELIRVHDVEMEAQRAKNLQLQMFSEAVKRESEERNETIGSLAREGDVLRKELATLSERTKWEKIESENLKKRSREEHRREMAEVQHQIKLLQGEVSNATTTITELRSSLDTKSSEAHQATSLAAERGGVIQRLEQNLFAARETLASCDQERVDAAASRALQESRLKDTISILRERILKLKDERTLAISNTKRELKRLCNDIVKLRRKFELSEEICYELQEKLAVYEMGGNGLFSGFWKWYYGVPNQAMAPPSPPPHDHTPPQS